MSSIHTLVTRPGSSSLTARGSGDTRGSHSSPWKVFPVEHWDALVQQQQQQDQQQQQQLPKTRVKLIHFLRHAQGTHNVDGDYKSERNIDARLTRRGFEQCQEFATGATKTKNMMDVDCVLSSPLTRCLQTALYSLPHLLLGETVTNTTTTKIPFVAKEFWRETVNYNCDRRRTLSEIQAEFPMVNFDNCNDEEDDDDALWKQYRTRVGPDWDTHMESAELYKVADRARAALYDLDHRPEDKILVCTHSAFLRCLLNWGQEGGVPDRVPQTLDDRRRPGRHSPPSDEDSFPHPPEEDIKLLEYANEQVIDHDGKPCSFETYMRRDFQNCEVRSFCLLCHNDDNDDDDDDDDDDDKKKE